MATPVNSSKLTLPTPPSKSYSGRFPSSGSSVQIIRRSRPARANVSPWRVLSHGLNRPSHPDRFPASSLLYQQKW